MTVHERITQYTVCALPEDHPEAHHFDVKVEYRGKGRWAVCHHGYVLDHNNKWHYEPLPSARTEAWLRRHRFGVDEARRRAAEVAPSITVNGWDPADL